MNDILKLAAGIEPADTDCMARARAHLDCLTKPRGSLGALEDIAARYVAATRMAPPVLEKKKVFVFAADHGVAAEGVSLYPREVTAQMVLNFIRGGAAVNVLAAHAGMDMDVIDMGVDHDFGDQPGMLHKKIARGTRNIALEPAMTEDELARAVKVGIELAAAAADRGFHLLATGEMGIGNTTPSSAIVSALTGRTPADVTGRGTGLDDAALKNKIAVVEKCLALHAPDPTAPLDVLRMVGGFEIAAITGLVLGAATRRVPVVVDGFISTAGALVACRLAPHARDYMFLGHRSVEPGHAAAVDAIGLRPILDLDMRLGEGTGAVLAATVIEAAIKIYNQMATFGDAGVSEAES